MPYLESLPLSSDLAVPFLASGFSNAIVKMAATFSRLQLAAALIGTAVFIFMYGKELIPLARI